MSSSVEILNPHTPTYDPPDPGCGCGGGPTSSGCGCGSLAPAEALTGLERPLYFPRQIVGPDDLNQGQVYVGDRMRRHNRFLHGWGIACGLRVTPCGPTEDGAESCCVRVSAGYALDPYGDEVFVPDPVVVDLCSTEPGGGLLCPPATDPWCAPVPVLPRDGNRYLAIRHVEIPVKPVRAPTGCSCSDTACENSRVRDWFEFRLLDELPSHYQQDCGDIDDYCASVAECPPCPDSGWVVLAVVRTNGTSVTWLGGERERRYLLSLAHFCERCDDERYRRDKAVLSGRPAHLLMGTASAAPDTTVSLDYYDGVELVRMSVATTADAVRGTTAADLKKAWDGVVLFDTLTGRPVAADDGSLLTAGTILAHSPLRGDSVIDGPEDLAVRVGRPAVDFSAYRSRLDEVSKLLDEGGRAEFEARLLGNLDRVGELGVEALSGISRQNAGRLDAVGIRTLAELREAKRVPDLAGSATAKAERFRALDLGGRD